MEEASSYIDPSLKQVEYLKNIQENCNFAWQKNKILNEADDMTQLLDIVLLKALRPSNSNSANLEGNYVEQGRGKNG